MEGISGICLVSQVMQDGAKYQEGRRYMTWDINACIQGCINGGAEKIVVRDIHSKCYNVIWEELDDRAEYYVGIPGSQRFAGIDGFDGLILLGYHAMAGCRHAILEHTSSTTWQNCWINGEKAGEFALEASRAGEHGVPVIMTSGDDKLCAEAKALIEDVVTVQVKTGCHTEGGLLLPPGVAHQRIREGAREAVRKCGTIKPYIIPSPVTVRVEFAERVPLPDPLRTGVKTIDGRTLETTEDSVEKAINCFI